MQASAAADDTPYRPISGAGRIGSPLSGQAKVLIAVMAFRCEPNRLLARWLEGKRWRYGSSPEFPTDVARNQTVNRFLAEDRQFDHLLIIDADMVPLADQPDGQRGTNAIFTEPGDILYCGFVGAGGIRGHFGDGDFGAACCRISRKVLEAMPPPWFRFPTNAAGTVRTGCECAYFRARAKLRWPIRMVGIMGHLQPMVLVPTPTGPRATSPLNVGETR
jgi:hypothetical protein